MGKSKDGVVYKSSEQIPEGYRMAVPLRVSDNAAFSFNDLEDKIELKLIHKETGKESERTYYKLEDRTMDATEAIKINTILYFMHNEIGINLWDEVSE